MTGHQLLATSTQAGKCGGTKRDKALYAQHDAGAKDLERWVLKRDKTAFALCMTSALEFCSRPHESAYAQHGRGVAEVGGSADLTPLQLS